VLHTFPEDKGLPDGMAIDARDNLWVALWGAGSVVRIDPVEGKITGRVRLPVSQITSCAFGGPDLRDLYITTAAYQLTPEQLEKEPLAGSLFVQRVDEPGPPLHRFREG